MAQNERPSDTVIPEHVAFCAEDVPSDVRRSRLRSARVIAVIRPKDAKVFLSAVAVDAAVMFWLCNRNGA
jgi:hypothetical protein